MKAGKLSVPDRVVSNRLRSAITVETVPVRGAKVQAHLPVRPAAESPEGPENREEVALLGGDNKI